MSVDIERDDVLVIAGERRQEETKSERGYEYSERSYGAFSRSIELPRDADASKIDADFRNGVLEVHIPKGQAARGRQVPIGGRVGGGRDEPRVIEPGDGGRQERHGSTNVVRS